MRSTAVFVVVLTAVVGLRPLAAQRTPPPVPALDWPNVRTKQLVVVHAIENCVPDEQFDAWAGRLTIFADDDDPIRVGQELCDILDRKGPFNGLGVMRASELPDGSFEFAVCYPRRTTPRSICPVFTERGGLWRVTRLEPGVMIGVT